MNLTPERTLVRDALYSCCQSGTFAFISSLGLAAPDPAGMTRDPEITPCRAICCSVGAGLRPATDPVTRTTSCFDPRRCLGLSPAVVSCGVRTDCPPRSANLRAGSDTAPGSAPQKNEQLVPTCSFDSGSISALLMTATLRLRCKLQAQSEGRRRIIPTG